MKGERAREDVRKMIDWTEYGGREGEEREEEAESERIEEEGEDGWICGGGREGKG